MYDIFYHRHHLENSDHLELFLTHLLIFATIIFRCDMVLLLTPLGLELCYILFELCCILFQQYFAQRLLCLKYSNQNEDSIRQALQNLKDSYINGRL
ncbi:hypothetical protein ACOSQ4_021223 [Xanthoceras sorbifolium]